MMLQVSDLNVHYGQVQALRDVSLEVSEGSITGVVGSNCAGKTSLLNAVMGLLHPSGGTILFEEREITSLPIHLRVTRGIVLVPENRHLFGSLSVFGNLESGAFKTKDRDEIRKGLEEVYSMFPILKERRKQLAGSLSGGEQQMLAIGRGLMSKPRLLMLDEPSNGLAPAFVEKIFETVKTVNDAGVAVLLVEQNVSKSLEIADKAFVMENGSIVLQGTGQELLNNERVKRAYLGL